MSNIKYSKKELICDETHISLKYDISDAFKTDSGVIVVLIEPDSFIGKQKDFKNLVAYNSMGKKLWEADFPQQRKPDYYWKISSRSPLIVKSFSSYNCEIDITTGKISQIEFYK